MSKMSYEEAYKEYKEKFSFEEYGISNIDKLRLISLLCFLTQELRKKTKETRVIDVIDKIVSDPSFAKRELYDPFLRNISFVCESLLHNQNGVPEILPFPTFELKTTKEIVLEIKKIINEYLPF